MIEDVPTRSMFFFGSLMDGEVLATVLGRVPAAKDRDVAYVRGWRRVFVAGRPYPMLIPLAGGRVEGLLVSGLGEREYDRLGFYEGWEYVTAPVQVRTLSGRTVETEMFTCPPGVLSENRDWKLDFWQRKHKAEALAAAVETMARFVRVSGA
ncbi:MAG: gamma-glutamylcyclotransferase family protein [Phaeospirillum sp.]|nr:gamma-glutamylcyclotransferase family protein [Phaeospirillum sp.]